MEQNSSRGFVRTRNWEELRWNIRADSHTFALRREREYLANYLEHTRTESDVQAMNDNRALTRNVALDCEMVGVGAGGKRSALARVSIVNDYGNVLLDTYVMPGEVVTDFRTAVSGVRPCDLHGSPSLNEVRLQVGRLLKGRILIGHGLQNDLKCLMIEHPKKHIRDTSQYRIFTRKQCAKRGYGKNKQSGRKARKLRDLVLEHLGLKVQCQSHSSVEDARCALYLYHKYRAQWEEEMI
eukprot:CAMPEP_0183798098 /NCGR_PEP_ID=MMETSP0803_2-20130417/17967_1 /TAXON_ID=195967 /ORGANISM="Crustomastix stigmata, Strain CCMP3273" /LENGTH=238 /DNA_ID=CAMNT_0026042773 /DNA_START=218 /DNA_END=934 /DNA_ORIENTATION=+